MKINVKDLVLSAMLAAITAVCAQLSFSNPLSSTVPFSFAILAVFLTGCIAKPQVAFLSQVVYLLIGVVGVPVFSKFGSGIGHLTGATGGYLFSYPLMALTIALILKYKKQISHMDLIGTMVVGLAICYVMGASWLGHYYGWGIKKSFSAGVAPFVAIDLIKCFLIAPIALKIRVALKAAKLT